MKTIIHPQVPDGVFDGRAIAAQVNGRTGCAEVDRVGLVVKDHDCDPVVFLDP